MSVFGVAEIEYLQSQRLGRLATSGPDGQPHVVPVSALNQGTVRRWSERPRRVASGAKRVGIVECLVDWL
jgi:Pyridoxamine 5'-phosphate oxidase